jgi:hypothetical protein
MAYSQSQLARGGQPSKPNTNVMLPEEKMMLRERRRIEAMIGGYSRNPGGYDSAYVSQLEQLAAQYDIPFNRVQGPAINQAGAAIGGFVDSFLWDLVPDDWYSSDATASARKWGKGVGLATAALATGGTSLLGRTATKIAQSGVGKFTTLGASLAAKKALAPTVAGYAKQGGMVGNVARGYMETGQGKNVAGMVIDDTFTAVNRLVKGGDKKAALEAIEATGDLTNDVAKISMAEATGAVAPGIESQVYAAAKGYGSAAKQAKGGIERVLSDILGAKGAGKKTQSAINTVLKDKNKLSQLEAILKDPNVNIDDAVDAIKAILPKSVRGKLVKKSDIVQTLATFWGFAGVGG